MDFKKWLELEEEDKEDPLFISKHVDVQPKDMKYTMGQFHPNTNKIYNACRRETAN